MQRLIDEHFIDPEVGFHFAYLRSFRLTSEFHCYNFYEIFITFGEPLIHLVNGELQNLADGSLVFIHPDDAHCYERGDGESQILNVAFSQHLLQTMVNYAATYSLSHFLTPKLPPISKLHKLVVY